MQGIPALPWKRLVQGWPTGVSWLAVPAILVVVVNVVSSQPAMHSMYGVWPSASAAWREHLLLVGPIVAIAGCAWAGRVTQGRSSLTGKVPSHGLSAPSILLAHTAAAASWWVSAYVLGVLPEMVWTWRTATAGSLDLWVVLHGLVGLLCYTVVGVAAGMILRSPAWALLVGVALLWWGMQPMYGARWLGALGPVQLWDMTAWDRPNLAVLTFSTMFCLAVSTLLVMAYLARVTSGVARWFRVVAAGSVVGVFGVTAWAWQPELVKQAAVSEECSGFPSAGIEVTVCLPPGHRKSRPQIEEVVQQMNNFAGARMVREVHESRSGVKAPTVTHVNVSPRSEQTVLLSNTVYDAIAGPMVHCMQNTDEGTSLPEQYTDEASARTALTAVTVAYLTVGHLDRPPSVVPGSVEDRVWHLSRDQVRAFLADQVANLPYCGKMRLP
ncbi:hypothetical protein KEM60_03321 [Austwickia sp. TVS 96-490-7B]|uniref:hypothetical protein n=1 Tax=Austwickia sp. TVS 96-490-7B TaxID=2830843 RepID=UPI001C57C30D|nr:hypothetical protein [Austwickia sp. TVS 96-490-7B]MBW3087091.1 hypothetical protein [Austwickia sp. TVS 96-490-7B]